MISNKSYNELGRANDGDRKFYDLPVNDEQRLSGAADPQKLFELIRASEIGHDQTFLSPFGVKKIVYCDYTASGRALSFIEDFIREQVLPDYGNTHTTSTVTSLQTTLFRSEARGIIRDAVNASENDCLIFTGSGCTGAVHKLLNGLNLSEPPLIFVSPIEHHSNLLPWRETLGEIVNINESKDGCIDLDDLEAKLKHFQDKNDQRVKIGCFSAASNLTGILTDVNKVTILLHKYGALAFWDYACAAPYVHINMNPFIKNEENGELAYKDAVYFSTHKFIGGPQTPGVLVAKKKLFNNRVPNGLGGGTVFYVTKSDHRFLKNEEMREEGGTPAIVESIRAGLVFQLKSAIGTDVIMERERHLVKKAVDFFKTIPNIHVLGNLNTERIPIFSFLVRHETLGLYLHPNFVTTILNDLFGITTRSGCQCAGPYSQYLLGINFELAKAYEQVLLQDNRLPSLRINNETSTAEIIRPGFTRFNLAFFFDDERVDFILNAIKFVCEHGWRFLPFYTFSLETGEWRHKNLLTFKDRKWLGNISYKDGKFSYQERNLKYKEQEGEMDCFKSAHAALESTKATVQIADQRLIFDSETMTLRWFVLPSEAYGLMHGIKSLYSPEPMIPPFQPRVFEFTEVQRQVEGIHDGGSVENRQASFESFIAPFEAQYDVESSLKLVRREVLSKVKVEPNRELNYIKEVHLESSASAAYKPSTPPTSPGENPSKSEKICLLPRKADANKKPKAENSFKHEWHSPQKAIFKPFIEAVNEFGMIRDGDRILVCLSGGKDSMTLLHTVKQYQYVCKSKNINFEFGAVTVDPKTSSYNPSSLKEYLAELNVPYFYEEQTILEAASNLPYECASICSFCSRMKRGRIYGTARKHGYNVLALGQHLDDFTESFMMSLFYNGKLWCMKAHYENEDNDLRIIRPFVYTREKELRSFAEGNRLPIIAENCPACFEAPKQRFKMKQILAQQELEFPCLFGSLLAAIKPIFSINKCQISVKTLTEFALKMIEKDPSLYQQLAKDKKETGDDDDISNDFGAN